MTFMGRGEWVLMAEQILKRCIFYDDDCDDDDDDDGVVMTTLIEFS